MKRKGRRRPFLRPTPGMCSWRGAASSKSRCAPASQTEHCTPEVRPAPAPWPHALDRNPLPGPSPRTRGNGAHASPRTRPPFLFLAGPPLRPFSGKPYNTSLPPAATTTRQPLRKLCASGDGFVHSLGRAGSPGWEPEGVRRSHKARGKPAQKPHPLTCCLKPGDTLRLGAQFPCPRPPRDARGSLEETPAHPVPFPP